MGNRTDTDAGITVEKPKLDVYGWADPRYGFAHPSIVATNRHLFSALLGNCDAEPTGRDNLKTMRLLSLTRESAAIGQVLQVREQVSAPA